MTPPPKTRDPNLDWSTTRPINVADLDFSTAEAVNPGEQINDVGNRVIVPDEGESFASTMQRAAAYGKTVTQEQINKETATASNKVATVLAAAPAIGAGGAAALGAPGMTLAGFEAMVPPTIEALAKIGPWAKANPTAAWLVRRAIDVALGATAIKYIKGFPTPEK
jgi:hypothetical protein